MGSPEERRGTDPAPEETPPTISSPGAVPHSRRKLLSGGGLGTYVAPGLLLLGFSQKLRAGTSPEGPPDWNGGQRPPRPEE